MNKILIFILSLNIILTSCASEYSDAFAEGEIKILKQDFAFTAAGKQITFEVMKSHTWRIDTTDIGSWCRVNAINNYDNMDYVTMAIAENRDVKARSTSFKIISDYDSKIISITQLGSEPTILINKADTIILGLENSVVNIELTTNIDFTMKSTDSWLSIAKSYVSDDVPVKLTIDKNSTGADREAKLIFTQTGGDYIKELVFIQKNENVEYEQGDVSNITGNHELKIISATASTQVDNKEITMSFDKNIYTYYQSSWQESGKNIELEYNFSGEQLLSYIIYTPYEKQPNYAFATTDIYVKTTTEDYKLIKTHTFSGVASQTVMLSNAISNPVSVKLVVRSVAKPDDGYNVGACAEIGFYASNFHYSDIFNDKSYSTLKTKDLNAILAMEDDFFRNIAEHLYHGTYPALRVKEYHPYPVFNPGSYAISKPYGVLDNVTGISVKKDEEIVVLVDKLKNNKVDISILNLDNNKNSEPFNVYSVALTDGINKFVAKSDGLIYVKYYSNVGEPVTIHIAGGTVNGYYDNQDKSGESAAIEYLNKSNCSHFDLLGKHVHLIFPTVSLKKNSISTLQKLVAKYDQIVELQQEFIGIGVDGFYPEIKNRICILPTNKVQDKVNVVLISDNDIDALTTESEIKDKILWNIASAISNVHSYVAFTALMPSVKDIYTVYVQQQMEGKNRLMSENVYNSAYTKFFINEMVYDNNLIKEDLDRVVSMWQLYLYMSKVKNRPNFYRELHKSGANYNNMAMFMMTGFSSVVKMNIDDFLKEWKYSFVKTKGEAAPKSLQYLTDDNIELFREPYKAIVPGGKYSVGNAEVAENKKITINANTQNAVAYEVIYRGGFVYASHEKSFTITNYNNKMQIFAIGADGERLLLTK